MTELQRVERGFADAILEASGNVIIVLDAEGHIVRFNHAAEAVTGWRYTELAGRPIWDFLIPPERQADVRKVFDHLVAGRIANRHENDWILRDGSRRLFDWYNTVLQDADGYVTHVIAQGYDITERKAAEARIERDREQQAVLRELLEIVLLGDALEATLQRCLDRILNVSWLSLLPKGGIFLMDENGQGLRLVSSHELSPHILAACGRLPLGCCHCGRAAASGEMQFAACVDERHEITYSGITDHGHYSLPIASGGQVLGVLVLYLPPHFERDAANEQFILSVTDILAGLLVRNRAEQALRDNERRLEAQVRERTAELARAQTLAHLGSWRLDIAANRLAWSDEAYRLFGVAPGTPLTLESFVACVHPDDRERVSAAWDAALAGAPYDIEHRVVIDSEVRWLRELAEIQRDSEGRPRIAFGAVQDITARKLAEVARERALAEAERLAQARSDFLANMSHEIRTPLNAVLGMAQIGLRESHGRKAEQAFGRILSSGQLLLGVVNDILDFSKIEAGKLNLDRTPFNLGSAIDHVLDLTAGRAYAKGLSIELNEAADLPKVCLGDQLRLSQVLVNLLGNAIKFTERGRVALEVRRDGADLSFRVADSGIGMSAEQQTRLFRPFEQADGSTTRRFGGTGLGLAISKRLADLMGGMIGVQSEPGRGSVFELRLPLKAEEGTDPQPHPTACDAFMLAGLAGDETQKLRTALEAQGRRVCCVDGAETALHTACCFPLLEAGCLGQPEILAAVASAVRDGRRLALAVRPGEAQRLPDALREQAYLIEYPLRARHLVDACAAMERSQTRTVPGGRLAGLRVLAAEDNEVNRLILADILALERAHVAFAGNGREALEQLEAAGLAAFDVVLMDVQMPVMDGYEATHRLCELAPGLPVIGLTAHAMQEDRERCLAAGMVQHLTKPIDVDALVAAILRHCRRPSLLPEAGAEPASSGPATPPEERTDTPVIDWAELLERFGGRQAFIDKLAATALDSQTQTPARLRDIVARSDRDALIFTAHSLKGMAGNLKATRLFELAKRTEASARQGEPEAMALAARLADTAQELLDALAERCRRARA